MSFLTLRGINKIYPNGFHAVHDFNLEIEKGEFIVFVGSSGCGKSTTLRMIAGLENISKGDFFIDGERVNEKGPRERGVAMVFQSYALYPHMTVYDNLAFGLTLQGVDDDVIEERVNATAKILGLTDYLDRFPRALSGGQRQRVAVGRAIIRKVDIFLMDEPLSNLDAKQRVTMRSEITQIHRQTGATTIYVTHDQTEAMTMGTRIVVMKSGLIQQVDTPNNLYLYPCNLFVAGFIGSPQMNFIESKLLKEGEDYLVEFGSEDTKTRAGVKYKIKLPASKNKDNCLEAYVGKEVIMGIRPENVHNEEDLIAIHKDGLVEADVEVTELMGAETYLYMNCEGQSINARVSPTNTARPGDKITIAFETAKIHLFDKDTELTICN